MPNRNAKLCRAAAGLLVIDIQERLIPAMHSAEELIENAARLIKGATVLALPVFASEQYRKGLGKTVPEISTSIAGFSPVEKLTFSAACAEGLVTALRSKKVSQVLLSGIETHVCVCQTCLDLLAEGLDVFVASDAVSSRTPENHRIGVERMRDAGAVIVSTEMALLELLGRAGTEE